MVTRKKSTPITFQNPSEETIATLLAGARTIAVIGLSRNPARPSRGVAASMLGFGYRIVPVNPNLDSWEGIRAFPTLEAATVSLGAVRIDIVNVFRLSRYISDIVDECLRLKLPSLWLQLGVVDEQAAARARSAGMTVVVDKCIRIERMNHFPCPQEQ